MASFTLPGPVLVLSLLVLVLQLSAAQRCQREPPDRNTAKTPGGGGFRIKFSGGVKTYTPGTIYTVKLMGWRTQFLSEKFTAFSLAAENERSSSTSAREAGAFQVFGFGLAKFHQRCPNTVTQTSTVPKTEAEVLWKAPPAGAGCVTFRAVVVRSRYVWYMDDEGLTKRLCEDGAGTSSGRRQQRQPQSDRRSASADTTCCACDEAKYQLRFDGLWSRETHPKDFPRNEWLTHFSDVLVGSHVPNISMWREGERASDGLKQVAEWGYTRKLEQELKVKGRALRTLTRAKGLWHPNVQGTTSTDFRVDKKRHHLSVVTMLGPSPDWILGISGLDLCLKNCSWMQEKVIDLGLYDAGTDSGISYESPNAPLSERQPVRAITGSWPDDRRAPFHGLQPAPVARVTLTRSQVIERSCDHQPDLERAGLSGTDQQPQDDRPECMVTPWSEWSECSVTCGEGLSMRTREYKLLAKAQMMNCKQQLVEKVLCDAPVTCDGRPRPPSDDSQFGDRRGVCALTAWSSWSPCSVTCGQGFRMRRRTYVNRMGRKKCFHDTEEKEKCMMSGAECSDVVEQEEQPDSRCPVTDWSFWSPCSVTCGRGKRVRARLLTLPDQQQTQCRHVNLMEEGTCQAGRADCTLNMIEAKKVCMMERETGPCRGNFERWYFEPMKGMCIKFIYGGCRGNRNNFVTFEECQTSCSVVTGGGGGGGGHGGSASRAPAQSLSLTPQPVHCMVTPWSAWGPCSVTCGRGAGRQRKNRMIKVPPQNGGRPCPRRLERYRRCRHLPPCI